MSRKGWAPGAKCDLAVFGLSLGWLHLARGRAAEAASEFRAAARLLSESGHDFPGFWPWRIGAAAAELALGRRPAAAELAREQLRLTRSFGAPGPIGIARRTLGLAEGGTAGLDLLAAASEELDQSPALLERAKAHLEFGAALRRAGKRTDSRRSLRLALDLADRCGAVPVAERAREEILANGGRPRRIRISGVEALTAGELRVARRAAQGRTNREIAQEMFVTTKAIEKHLASTYRKLEIEGRGELAELSASWAPIWAALWGMESGPDSDRDRDRRPEPGRGAGARVLGDHPVDEVAGVVGDAGHAAEYEPGRRRALLATVVVSPCTLGTTAKADSPIATP